MPRCQTSLAITAGGHRCLQGDGAAGSSGGALLPCTLSNASGSSTAVSADTGKQRQGPRLPSRYIAAKTPSEHQFLVVEAAVAYSLPPCALPSMLPAAGCVNNHMSRPQTACSIPPQATMAPADLLKSLLAMQKAGFVLPDIAPNEIGLSIVTSWLHERFARLCSVGYRSEVPAADMGAHIVERLLLIITMGHVTCVVLAMFCWLWCTCMNATYLTTKQDGDEVRNAFCALQMPACGSSWMQIRTMWTAMASLPPVLSACWTPASATRTTSRCSSTSRSTQRGETCWPDVDRHLATSHSCQACSLRLLYSYTAPMRV